jgi:hypothetical protein
MTVSPNNNNEGAVRAEDCEEASRPSEIREEGSSEIQVEQGEETRQPKGLTTPIRPSQHEVDKHNLNHATFRNWCEFCVKGRGKEAPHRAQKGEALRMPTICMDFGYMREKPKQAGEDSRPILVTKCRGTGHISADMLISKDHGYGVRRIVQYVEKVLGYKRVMIK